MLSKYTKFVEINENSELSESRGVLKTESSTARGYLVTNSHSKNISEIRRILDLVSNLQYESISTN
jgi:hypothetical protein